MARHDDAVTLDPFAAAVFAFACAGVIAFQLGLAAGAPWGHLAMGGRYPGRFPTPMRIAAAVQAAVIALLALVVLSDANLVFISWADALPWIVWRAGAFSALSVALNAITQSPAERRLWLPVAVVMFAASLTVALV